MSFVTTANVSNAADQSNQLKLADLKTSTAELVWQESQEVLMSHVPLASKMTKLVANH
jgi:hypothetical protein